MQCSAGQCTAKQCNSVQHFAVQLGLMQFNMVQLVQLCAVRLLDSSVEKNYDCFVYRDSFIEAGENGHYVWYIQHSFILRKNSCLGERLFYTFTLLGNILTWFSYLIFFFILSFNLLYLASKAVCIKGFNRHVQGKKVNWNEIGLDLLCVICVFLRS